MPRVSGSPSPCAWVILAMPKSRIFTVSGARGSASLTSITLAGLRSRWTTPSPCACSRARRICPAIWQARAGSRRRSRASTSESGWPATNSITRKSSPAAPWPKSVTAMMFGWLRRLADCASRSKRRAASATLLNSGRKQLERQHLLHVDVLDAEYGAHAALAHAAQNAVALADDGVGERIARDVHELGGGGFGLGHAVGSRSLPRVPRAQRGQRAQRLRRRPTSVSPVSRLRVAWLRRNGDSRTDSVRPPRGGGARRPCPCGRRRGGCGGAGSPRP